MPLSLLVSVLFLKPQRLCIYSLVLLMKEFDWFIVIITLMLWQNKFVSVITFNSVINKTKKNAAFDRVTAKHVILKNVSENLKDQLYL